MRKKVAVFCIAEEHQSAKSPVLKSFQWGEIWKWQLYLKAPTLMVNNASLQEASPEHQSFDVFFHLWKDGSAMWVSSHGQCKVKVNMIIIQTMYFLRENWNKVWLFGGCLVDEGPAFKPTYHIDLCIYFWYTGSHRLIDFTTAPAVQCTCWPAGQPYFRFRTARLAAGWVQ